MSAATEVLRIDDLCAGYPGRPVISGLTLDPFAVGQVTALVGPNAAGKSTLMLALAGLVRSTGSVRFGPHELLGMPIAERARIVTFMPQALPQSIALSVLESVMASLNASPTVELGPRGKQVRRRALDALERLSIANLALESLNRLSGGQRQLVSLAQSVVREPRIMLLDEPTSALDLHHQVSVMALVRELAREGRIVVVVLHDLNLAARWADRVVVISGGAVAAQGDPASAITSDMLADVYGVEALIEHSSRGHLQVCVEGKRTLPSAVATCRKVGEE